MNQTDQTDTLYCPKCQGTWRRIERNGVVIDQCEQCQGIFLDRGELEQLINAERNYYNSQPPAAGYPQQQYPSGQGGFLGSLLGGHHSGRRYGGHH
ncbi:MAG: zf-TFIIB domain-containing protein [Cryobacterium sp.]|nr:zf-TFIIB domain-containing protein [Cryobacterium sp.]